MDCKTLPLSQWVGGGGGGGEGGGGQGNGVTNELIM